MRHVVGTASQDLTDTELPIRQTIHIFHTHPASGMLSPSFAALRSVAFAFADGARAKQEAFAREAVLALLLK